MMDIVRRLRSNILAYTLAALLICFAIGSLLNLSSLTTYALVGIGGIATLYRFARYVFVAKMAINDQRVQAAEHGRSGWGQVRHILGKVFLYLILPSFLITIVLISVALIIAQQ